MRKRITSMMVIVALLVSSMATSVHAMGVSAESEYDKFSPIAIATAIDNASYVTSASIAGEQYTYYYGEDYVITYDGAEYHRIDRLSDGQISLDGVIYGEVIKLTSSVTTSLMGTRGDYEWLPLPGEDPFTYSVDVIGVAPGILGGMIGAALSGPIGAAAAAALGTKVGTMVGGTFSIVGGAIAGTLAGGAFPHYYVTVHVQRYYQSPVVTQRPVTKLVTTLYHGPTEGSTANIWFVDDPRPN